MEIFVTVAPNAYTGPIAADFVCTGRHDERILQQAVEKAAGENRNVMLLNGVYHIDGFSDPYQDGGPAAAICFPHSWREFRLMGENHEYGF